MSNCTTRMHAANCDCLWWHCHGCGAHELAEPGAQLGDKEKCITCGEHFAEVMTTKQAAALEQRIAMGRAPGGAGEEG